MPTTKPTMSYAERRTALAADKTRHQAEHDASTIAARKMLVDAATKRDQADVAADAAAIDADRAVEGALAADFYATMRPLVASFGDDERGAAKQIADVWARFDARCMTECGDHLDAKHVGMLFALAVSEDAARLLAARSAVVYDAGNNHALAMATAEKLLRMGAPHVAIRDALCAVEREIAVFARSAPGVHLPSPTRLACIMSTASVAGQRTALAAHDEAAGAAKRAAALNEPQLPRNNARVVGW